MGFFSRMANGWYFATTCLSVVMDNKRLLVFPVLSSAAAIAVLLMFLGTAFVTMDFDDLEETSYTSEEYESTDSTDSYTSNEDSYEEQDSETASEDGMDFEKLESEISLADQVIGYAFVFVYYFISYLIMIFFNVALVHCSVSALRGKPVVIREGLKVARLRTGSIVSWAAISATVGTALSILEDSGKIGEIISAIIGIAWTALTYFVIPIVIYEDRSAIDSIKRSGSIMKQQWGEALTASFSFSLFYIIGLIVAAAISWVVFQIHFAAGVVCMITMIVMLMTVVATLKSVLVAALYMHAKEHPSDYFETDRIESAFA